MSDLDILQEHAHLKFSQLWLSTDSDLQAEAWAGETGAEWAARNPTGVEGTNKSWQERFRIDKVMAIREAAHNIPKDTSWLEVGCSSGAHMRCVQAAGWQDIQGCDVNAEAIKEADRAVWADARALPFEDDSFDVVTTSGALMHMGPDERMTDCLMEMVRVSRKWLFLVELYSEDGTLTSFGDLLPPAWVMAWDKWLPQKLPSEWRLVRGRVLVSPGERKANPIAMMLLVKD